MTTKQRTDSKTEQAYKMLDNQNDYGASKQNMLDDLTFEFGYTPEQAEQVYNDWLKDMTR